MRIEGAPLAWPDALKSRHLSGRIPLDFKVPRDPQRVTRQVSIPEAWGILEDALEDMRVSYGVLSSGVRLLRDGRPGRVEPADPAVVLYFGRRGRRYALVCDRYLRWADNACAIARHIGALCRVHGYGIQSLESLLSGAVYASGPVPVWVEVLGAVASPEEARAVYRELSRTAHPDGGGSTEAMVRLREALDAALVALA